MKGLTKFAVDRPVTTIMTFIGVFLLGVTSFTRLGVDLMPDIDPPMVSVMTAYPGASAEDIEVNITEVLEDEFVGISGLDELQSTSADNISNITLEFTHDKDLDEAANDIRDAIDLIRPELPDEADRPIIFKFDTGMIPVVILGVTADEHYPEIHELLDETLVPEINRIQGTGNVMALGGPERQVRVELSPERLEAYELSAGDIGSAIQANNLNMPGGNIKMGRMDYNIRITGEFETPRDFGEMIISMREGRMIQLSDVADVYDGMREPTNIQRINGREGVAVIVQKQDEANTVEIAEEIDKILPDVREQLPDDVELTTIIDTSEFIQNSIDNLTQVLFYAGLFVILVVLLFLRRLRSTFIIILTVPFALIVALIYLYFGGNTLNIISLSSLAIAMGMVVDDAIVILENITTHSEEGSRPREAALYGTNEVGVAVVATTLAVVAVFLPLTFITGMAGILFTQLGIIVSLTVVTSTVAALTLTPMLSSKLLRPESEHKKGIFGNVSNVLEKGFNRVENSYKSILTVALYNKVVTIIIAALIFGGSLLLIPVVGTEFMPDSDNGQISMDAELQTGYRLEESAKMADSLEALIEEEYGHLIENMSMSMGTDEMGFDAGEGGPHVIETNMSFVPVDQRDISIFDIGEELREALFDIPGITQVDINAGGGGLGGGAERPVEVQVRGFDQELTMEVADTIQHIVSIIEGTRDVENSMGEQRPQLEFDFDREKMADVGLNVATTSETVRDLIAGRQVSTFRDDGHEYDVFMRYRPEHRTSISDLENIPIFNPQGDMVRLGDFGTITEEGSPLAIERIDRQRAVLVTSNIYDRPLGDVSDDIQNAVDRLDLPPGITVDYGADIEDQEEAFGDLTMLFLLSLFLVFAVMASQFESLRDPFIVMFAIPFGFSGVVLALFLAGEPISLLAFLGIIILVGIVAKNAIVMVDYTNLMVNRKMELYDAVVYAGGNRLRPVLMTTLTTVLAMLPLVFSLGEGSEVWRPMGLAVTGGLLVSTAVTLLLIPVMYVLIKKGVKIKSE